MAGGLKRSCSNIASVRRTATLERLPERTSPELAYLETKFAALVSDGLIVELLREVLPIHQE